MLEKNKKVFVIGLDCATPQLVFEKYKDILPNLKRLIENGISGPLESTHPPITVPAWTSMMSSKEPGQLGFYGFRNRKNYTYDDMYFANSKAVKDDRVWDILSFNRKRSIVIGVPQTYPPRPLNGEMVASFLTPDTSSDYTYPKALKKEIKEVVGEYIIDVKNFRTEDKDWLLEQIYEMTEKRFALVNHLLDSREWDFFMFVEMGVDRIHHGFWKWEDPSHPKYESGHKYNNAIRRYYIYLDKEIGKILKRLEELQEKEDSEITVLVVSDHGAKAMKGGICFNEWLIKEGLLTLKEKPKGMVKVENWMIDWGRTKVWGAGGYYGRLFINVKGREPKGVVPKEEYEKFRDELIEKLVGLVDEEGRNIGTKVLKPEESYREVKNIPPDLIVYFGNLDWRSVGSVGTGSIYTYENDTGPDDANHDMYGIFIMSGPNTKKEWREDLKIYDVAPTILELLGVDVPKDMIGKAVK